MTDRPPEPTPPDDGPTPPDGDPSPDDAAPFVDTSLPVPPRRLVRGSQRLGYLLGRRLLVGVSLRDASGVLVRQEQFCGRVLEVTDGVVVVERNGEQAVLPADEDAYAPAPPGEYRLGGSGEIVVNPDYVTVWNVLTPPPPPA